MTDTVVVEPHAPEVATPGLAPAVAARPASAVAATLVRLAMVVAAATVVLWPAGVALVVGGAPGATAAHRVLAGALVVIGVAAGVTDPRPHRVNVHDRETDAIVGIALLAVGIGTLALFPGQVGDLGALWRPDLLGGAVFLAGALCVALGVRTAARCWPALLGLALLHPAVVQLVLVPASRAWGRLALAVAEATAGPGASPVEGAELALTWPADGVHRVFDLGGAVGAYAVVAVGAMVLLAVAVLARGRLLARVALVVLGTAALLALVTARLALGVWVARRDAALGATLLGPAVTTVVAVTWGALAVVLAWRLGLRGPTVERAAVGGGGRRLGLAATAAILGVAAVTGALVDRSRDVPLPGRPTAAQAVVLATEAVALPDHRLARTESGDTPYRTAAPQGGGWRRVTYEPAEPGAGPITLDVLDVPDPELLALSPSRLLYRPVGADRAVTSAVEVVPGLEGQATTWFAGGGKLVLSTLVWTWTTPGGEVRQVALAAAGPGGGQVPAPAVDHGAALADSLSEILRGAGHAEAVARSDVDVAAARLLAAARALIGQEGLG